MVAYLLEGKAGACAFGPVTWTKIHDAWRGEVPISAEHYGEHSLSLTIQCHPKRPTEPTVLLIWNSDSVTRVDFNGGHLGQRFSHWHRPRPDGSGEVVEEVPGEMYCPAPDQPLRQGDLKRIFLGAGGLFQVDCSAVDWDDPPWGVEA